MQNLQLDDSLKLTFCPRCDYSLHGLTEIGICPECGDAYNTDFIILRGKPVTMGDEPNGQQYPSVADLIASAILFAVLWVLAHFSFPPALLLLLVILSAGKMIRSLVVWFSSIRKGDVLVWISSIGIGEQPFVDADSFPGRCLHYWGMLQAVTVFPTIILLWLTLFWRENLVLGIVLFIVLLFPCYLIFLGRKPTPALRASGIRPAMLPWRAFGEIELEELGSQTFHLWARKLESNRIRDLDVIKIEFRASASGGTQLVDLLRQWCGAHVKFSFKPLDRSPGSRVARKAGLLTGRLFKMKPRSKAAKP